jgi:transposase InsO family protein
MAVWLATQGHVVNRKRVRRLMRLLGLVAIYQRPNTSKSAAAHKIYPYLLGGMAIERVNQVWCADVTYIPMPKGFLYLVVIMDWVSRAVLAWRLSNTLGPDFCVEALEEALARDGRPEICKIGDERRTAFRRSVSRRLFPVGSRTGAPVGQGIPTIPRFQPPPRRNAACGFPALRAPICFTSRLMGPITPGQLSVHRVALDSC